MSNLENKIYNHITKTAQFKEDLKTLGKFCKIISLEIEFNVLGDQELFLHYNLEDHLIGTYSLNSLFVQMVDNDLNPIFSLFDLIDTTLINNEDIQALAVHCEMEFLGNPVEFSIELTGRNSPPKILSVSNMHHYYDISRVIQAKWYILSHS